MRRRQVTYTGPDGKTTFIKPRKLPVVVDGKIVFKVIGKETPAQLRKRQLDLGEIIEQEHYKDKKKARHVASQHLPEVPNYYDKLIPAEKQWIKEWKKK